MKRINMIRRISACLLAEMILMPIGIAPVSAETIPVATDTADITYEDYTFADYYAMPDEELMDVLDYHYLGGSWDVPEVICFYTADHLDAKAELLTTYADEENNYSIKPELLEDFCNTFGEIPAEYIADVVFNSSEDPSFLGNIDIDPETGAEIEVDMYEGFVIYLNTPEDYEPGRTLLSEESTKVLHIIQKLIEQNTDIYDALISGYAFALPPQYTGDINRDYDINLCDVILLEKALAGTVELEDSQLTRADCNGNGEPDADDAYLLLCFVLQIIDTLPAS